MFHVNDTSIKIVDEQFSVSMFITLSNGKFVRVTQLGSTPEKASDNCLAAAQKAEDALRSD